MVGIVPSQQQQARLVYLKTYQLIRTLNIFLFVTYILQLRFVSPQIFLPRNLKSVKVDKSIGPNGISLRLLRERDMADGV